jgi:hypothetical protein
MSSFVADGNSLKFASHESATVKEFQDRWKKKLTLGTRTEIEYDAIKSVTKEDNDRNILIKYRAWAGFPGELEFAFQDYYDHELFFRFLEKERYFKRVRETLTPIRAIRNHVIGLSAVIVITALAYYEAVGIANGTIELEGSGKEQAFKLVASLLGDKAVIAIGTLIVIFLLYKIRRRISSLPNQTKLLPPNA